ncbi:PAS domain S-box-containing protein [Anaerospora hongkongensis]|uniref:PAS domain S-box-containing protein n=1 Tax=Anaerospora hongkongensis TaxID=244830 RepID=A0A4V2Q8C6_9FIRM|nr:sigma 54-interacting transcriptional regulator [Anaerospora hongkongensis]TCL35687.1 PAS domain S-box-containing protein [Anaerospora hongkongensis]
MNKPVTQPIPELKEYLETSQFDKVIDLFEQINSAYRLQQARLETLLDTVNEAICMIDEEDRVLVWNRQAEALYGIKALDIIGQPIDHFFSNLKISTAMKQHQPVVEEYHAPCPETHVLINSRPIMLDGQAVGGISAERDITDLVQLNQKLSQTNREVQSLKKTINTIHSQNDPFSAIYGRGEAIGAAVRLAKRVSATNVPVLLRGESGTGKELFARAIHEASQVNGAFIAINCGAIPANLFESELFGYQPGAFTGADRKGKEGLLEKANGGTLLLDEVGDMPREMQVKLLRTLQEKCLYRVGGNKAIPVDFRVIAATHRNLEDMIRTGEFREDLYYRLNVVSIVLPPLRERLDDLPELLRRGLQYYSALYNKNISKVDPAVMAALVQYQWPGNIRELLNALERLVILTDGDTLSIADLPQALFSPEHVKAEGASQLTGRLPVATAELEREIITRVLEEQSHNKALAAQKLGIPRSTLYYKMQKLGICQ